MVVEPVSVEISSEATSISVPACNSIVLPSKKVISALEPSPDFTLSPGSRDIPTCASIQLSVPAFITNTFPSVIESIVSVDGVEGGTVGSGVGVSEGEGVVSAGTSAGTSATSPFDGSWPW